MKTEKITQALLNQIKVLIGNKDRYEGWFLNYDDDYDFIVKYKIESIRVWKVEDDKLCKYEGFISVKVNELLVGISEQDEWERMYGWDDIPETSWDYVKEDILSIVEKLIPQICLDVDFTS